MAKCKSCKERNEYIMQYTKENYIRVSVNFRNDRKEDLELYDAIFKEAGGNLQAGIKSLLSKAIRK